MGYPKHLCASCGSGGEDMCDQCWLEHDAALERDDERDPEPKPTRAFLADSMDKLMGRYLGE